MEPRKNFSYRTATVQDVVQHFMNSTKQSISTSRRNWKNDPVVGPIVEEAYRLYKFAVLEAKLSQK